ncbi:MAG: hypothetical protein IKI74_04070 [Christensenellaceae bacterium]|nr:hypothetical protein [Christensenellaceae bacterium]
MQERRRASARSSKSNRKGIRVQPRFFIFAGILLGIIAAVIVLIATAQHTVPVEEGTIGFSMSGTGIVIRKETLYQTENYGKSVFIAKEGQHVSSGAVIADVYTWDYSDSIVSQLKNLENKIMDYQLTSLESQGIPEELTTYNKKIQQMSNQISRLLDGRADGDLFSAETELRHLMSERSDLLYESVQEDDTLNGYIEQEAFLTARIDEWRKTITAAGDGLISFYFDGCETLLTPDNMKKLTAQQLTDIVNGKIYYTIPDTNAARPLYRLVNEHEWYICMISDTVIPEFENNNIFNVYIDGDRDIRYHATVDGYTESGKKYIYYLEFADSLKELLLQRSVIMDIEFDYSGLKVSRKSIFRSKDENGVYIRNAEGKKQFVPVNILIDRDGYCIVEAKDGVSLGKSSIIYER